MISICIPIFNRDVRQLVSELYWQAEALDVPCEIVLMDDASDVRYQLRNRGLQVLSNVRYEELTANVGRAVIRNLLAKKAVYPYLLFIDNDTRICSESYLSDYIKQCTRQVVCYGSYAYLPCDNQDYYLRWLYGTQREAVPIEMRLLNPDRYFSTFNFLIDADVFKTIQFDEKITEYGYEDTFFQVELLKRGYAITQIDNPLIHEGLMTHKEFLERTQAAVRNLARVKNPTNLRMYIRLLDTYCKLSRFGLTHLVAGCFVVGKKLLQKKLLGNKPSLFIFDLYKLGYLCTLK